MPVIRAILFSSAFHVGLILVLIWLAPLMVAETPTESVEIEYFPEGQILDALTRPQQKQIVRQAPVPEKLLAPEDENMARYLSAQKQRVYEETRTTNSGMTANRSNTGNDRQNDSPSSARPKAPLTETSTERSEDGYKKVDITRELQEMNRLPGGISTTGENLPTEMKVGSFTALNTDRYIYYTFYARIEELTRYRWESRVENVVYSLNNTLLLQAGNRDWNTDIEFLLDETGALKHARIMKESGITGFDGAAVNAFKEARIFPNPPRELIQEDGFIHIKYRFTVRFDPRAIVERR